MPGRVIATIFAFASFSACLIYGAYMGVESVWLITNAVLVMMLCYVVGRVGGYITQRCVDEHIDQYKKQHPIPDEQAAVAEAGAVPPVAESGPATGQP